MLCHSHAVAVNGVKVTSLTDTSVNVSWNAVIIPDFPIDNYTVVYSPVSESDRRQDGEMTAVFPGSVTSGVITDPVIYQFQVFANVTVNGVSLEGEWSIPAFKGGGDYALSLVIVYFWYLLSRLSLPVHVCVGKVYCHVYAYVMIHVASYKYYHRHIIAGHQISHVHTSLYFTLAFVGKTSYDYDSCRSTIVTGVAVSIFGIAGGFSGLIMGGVIALMNR